MTVEIVRVTYPGTAPRNQGRTYWRVFIDGEHVESFESEAEAQRYVERLRDCERLGA